MTAATEYAKALFELSGEEKKLDAVMLDVSSLVTLLSENPEYTRLLDTPAIPKEERIELIDEAFATFDIHLVNLIKILSEHHASHLLPKILREYSDLYDEARDIVRAEVISAYPLSDTQLSRLENKLSAKCKKSVKLTAKTDKNLLGGVKIRYLGTQIDATVRARLDAAERHLKGLVI